MSNTTVEGTRGESSSVVNTVTCNVVTPTENFTLTANDRCDACSAQAYYKVDLQQKKGTLMFCGHHYKKHEAKLLPVAQTILDETSKLK